MPEKNYCMGIYEFDQKRKEFFRNEIKTIIESHTGLSFEDAGLYYESESIKMDFIERMIADSTLIIADITRLNANVFLELGIAYALRKKIILLCEQEAWETGCPTMIPGKEWSPTRVQSAWKKNPPFDLSGRDILVYKNYNELKVKLSESLFDVLYNNRIVVPSWSSCVAELTTGKYSTPTSHIVSPGKLSLEHEDRGDQGNDKDKYEFEFGKAWNSSSINNSFHFSCKVHLSGTNSDFRVCLSSEKDGLQRVAIIFPWELDPGNHKSCHVTYYDDYTRHSKEDGNVRLQEVDAGKPEVKSFRFSVSFCWPNLVIESDAFRDDIDRLCVSLDQLRGFGYPVHQKQFIGFNVRNGKAEISEIKVKEAL